MGSPRSCTNPTLCQPPWPLPQSAALRLNAEAPGGFVSQCSPAWSTRGSWQVCSQQPCFYLTFSSKVNELVMLNSTWIERLGQSKSNYKRENAQFVAGSCGGFLNVCCSSVPTGPSGSGGGPSITSSVETLPQTVVSTSSPSSTGEGSFRYSHWPIFLPTCIF